MDAVPWQLRMFGKSTKKKIKVAALREHLGYLEKQKCLLITNGDNNGAMNYHFRSYGGTWTWADFKQDNIPDMEELLGQRVVHIKDQTLDFPSSYFDCIVIIDVHEHLEDPQPLNKELLRITKAGGRIIVTTPSNSVGRPITRLRNSLGMTKEMYGHVREGYNIDELEEMLRNAGVKPYAASDYSKFFTELLELMINFTYMKVISRKGPHDTSIAPTRKDQLRAVKKSYGLYSLAYPILWCISRLDSLLAFSKGYAVIVAGQKV